MRSYPPRTIVEEGDHHVIVKCDRCGLYAWCADNESGAWPDYWRQRRLDIAKRSICKCMLKGDTRDFSIGDKVIRRGRKKPTSHLVIKIRRDIDTMYFKGSLKLERRCADYVHEWYYDVPDVEPWPGN